MDFNALSALATSALTAHASSDFGSTGETSVANGAAFPNILAYHIIGLTDGPEIDQTCAFCLGFDLALQLGAMLALEPLKLPNLKGALSEAKRELKTYQREAVA